MILFELLVALSLMAILLTFLFSFFVQSAKIEKTLDVARAQVAKRGYVQTRLQSIFTSIDRSASTPCFYTRQLENKEINLMIQFDNGIDPDPVFSGPVVGRIYLDQEHNLSLMIWPLQDRLHPSKNSPWRSEILYPNIQNLTFTFLGSNHASQEKETSSSADVVWQASWLPSMGAVPNIIRMTFYERGNRELVRYAFMLPVSEPFVTYREKRIL